VGSLGGGVGSLGGGVGSLGGGVGSFGGGVGSFGGGRGDGALPLAPFLAMACGLRVPGISMVLPRRVSSSSSSLYTEDRAKCSYLGSNLWKFTLEMHLSVGVLCRNSALGHVLEFWQTIPMLMTHIKDN
jgi:hypothetical protein